MKRIIILNYLLLTLPIITFACSESFDDDGEKVKTAFIQTRGINPKFTTFSEIKFIRNVTVQDSINDFLEATDEIISDYNSTLQGINHWTELKKKEANSYTVYNHDSYIQKFTDELNMFADAYEGKFSNDLWKHYYTYSNLYRLRKMDPSKIVGKIYSITYTTRSGTKTESWLFDSEITKTIGSVLYDIDLKVREQRDMEKIHFKRYEETPNENDEKTASKPTNQGEEIIKSEE